LATPFARYTFCRMSSYPSSTCVKKSKAKTMEKEAEDRRGCVIRDRSWPAWPGCCEMYQAIPS